jgi:putative CocE/NonD family hydrolase
VTSTRRGDRAVSRALRLPAPSTDYRVHRQLPIPMRDGVELRADHYEPLTDRPVGTILVRGPYGRGFPFSFIYAQIYAARGYHVLLQSVRGTFGSGGTFVPMVHEVDDAADTVVWLREQPWFTGTFGTIGLSYLGYTQWALLSDPPPELAAAVISVGPHDFHSSSWGTGSFALNDFLGWSDMMAHQERTPMHRLTFQFKAARRLASAVHNVPLGDAGRTLLGEHSPWYESWIEHPEVDDAFWEPMRMTHALDRCAVPVLLIGGWQDIFIDQTITQYQYLHRRGVDVAMTVGKWTHDEIVTKAIGSTAAETLDWLGTHVGKSGTRTTVPRAQPVRVYVTGHGNGWIDLPDWPPPTVERLFYPNYYGVLAPAAPAPGGRASSFCYDPAEPTPTVGGRLLTRNSGYTDDTALAERTDVVTFTTAPLEGAVTVFGHPVVELDYQSDNPHFDVFVRVSEVDERGRSRNVSDGFRRFDGAPDGPIRMELDPVAHRFSPGSRIRVLVAGGCHPRFARNLGTGEPPVSGSRMVGSTHTIAHGQMSRLILPVGG